MPLYEYRCQACGHRFEKIQTFSAPDEKECPLCQGEVERLISAPAVHFSGSGFYSTDYPSKSSGAPKSEAAPTSDGGAKEGGSSAGDKSSSPASAADSGSKSGSGSDSSSSAPSASSPSTPASSSAPTSASKKD